MKIPVTQYDIDHGVRRSCTACPIALAVNHYTGRMWRVGLNGAHLSSETQIVPWPRPVRIFIAQFDDYGPGGVRPFTFEFAWEKPDAPIPDRQ